MLSLLFSAATLMPLSTVFSHFQLDYAIAVSRPPLSAFINDFLIATPSFIDARQLIFRFLRNVH